mmetsp:Transcript_7354/g.11520  ORF Transcript_7354/g.11520 Transcript_7354/m.11520 type:complete len:212 (+) Transcript_7354:1021-1656(+)
MGASVSLLTRCSNWSRNIFKKDSEETISARFQVGALNVKNQNYMLEMKELLVTFRLKHNCSHKECKKHAELARNPGFMSPMALRTLLPNKEMHEFCSLDLHARGHLHRLLPKFDNLGNFFGCYVMFNTQTYFRRKVTLIDNKEMFERIVRSRSSPNNASTLHSVLQRVGEMAEVLKINERFRTAVLWFRKDNARLNIPIEVIREINADNLL